MKVHELIADEHAWCQNYYALDWFYNQVKPTSSDACHWCLHGALVKCYPDMEERTIILRKLYDYLCNTLGFVSITSFNDNNPHEKVLDLVKKLDI